MVPMWMLPIAIACRNTFVLKPSEKNPLTANRLAELATVARSLDAATAEDSDEAACAKLVDWLEALNRNPELPRLSACKGVTQEKFAAGQVEKMAADALASGIPANNPRIPSAEEIVTLDREAS